MGTSGWTWVAITFHRSRRPTCSTLEMKMRPTPASRKGFFAGRERKRIRPEERVALDLDDRERELTLQYTFADDQLTRRLRIVITLWSSWMIWRATWRRRQTTRRTRS